jgi:hypothetical protein
MERSSQEEKARIQVEFTAMYTKASFLTKSFIPIKIDSAHAIAQYKAHTGYSEIHVEASK